MSRHYVCCLCAGVLIALGVVPSVQAATYGLKSHGRAVGAINPSSAYSDLRDDTGWLLTGPAVVDLNADSGNAGADGAHVSAILYAESNYGLLHVSGHGDSSNSSTTGDFSWDTSYIGSEPNAWYKDRIEIVSSTLPAGTPVTLQFTLTFSGFASTSPPLSGQDTHATLHGQLTATSSPYPSITLDVGTTTTAVTYSTQETGIIQSSVGSYIDLQSKFWIDMSAMTNILSSTHYSQSYDFDGVLTTQIEMMTAGASYVADSSGIYVPEPASLSLLAMGFLFVAGRRRQG